jgi:hypothetical protein
MVYKTPRTWAPELSSAQEGNCDVGWNPLLNPKRTYLGQAEFFERQACTLEIGQFHLRILS